MKKLKQFTLFFLLFAPFTQTKGQVVLSLIFGDKLNTDELSFGLHFDYSWNTLSGIHPSSSLAKFDLGTFLTYKLNEKWRANVEMMAKYSRGAAGMKPYSVGNATIDAAYASGEFTRNIGYLALPVTIQYLLSKEFYFEAGPSMAIRLNAKDKFAVSLPQGESALERDSKANISTFDVGMLGGMGLLIGKAKVMSVGVRYGWGFSDVVKDMAGQQSNNSFYIYTHMPIGRAKAARKRAEAAAAKQ